MKCPVCIKEMTSKLYRGIQVDQCGGCQGVWLDSKELDDLEDCTFADDDLKGSLMLSHRQGLRKCPKCDVDMRIFRYRAFDLDLDFCSAGHGYWLDKDEENRVEALMQRRIKELNRSAKAEAEWGLFLKSLRRPSLLEQLKNLFRK